MTRVDPRSRAAGSLLVLLLAIGCGSEQTSRKTDIGATTPPPTILSFDAAPRSIPAGQPVTLAWTTRNADTIAIADDRGAPVPVEGLAVAAGEVEVFPTTTTVYTLSATGPEGSPGPGSRSVTVTVVPPTAEVPTIESFAASVPEVALGGTVSLSWSTTGATSVTLRDDLGEVVSSAGPAEGSVDVRPVRSPTLYLLTATGPGGRATAQVEVGVVGLPRVHRFLVEPLEPVAAGTTVVLTWETSRADDIRIVDEHEVTVVSTAEAVGRHELVLADTTRFELIASREGVEARAQVLARVGPTIETFSVLPRLARAGDPLLLSWKTAGADTVTISGPGSYRYDVPAAERNEGTTTVALPESGDYVLTALRGTVAKTWAVFAEATRRPLLRSLEADPTTVTAASDLPATVRLSYVQDGGSTCTVRRNNVVVPGLDALPCGRTGTLDVPVTGTADLRLVVRNGDGEDQRSVHVDAVPPARVQSFTKTPARRLGPGGAVTLAWTVTDAVSVGMTKNGLPVAIGAGAFDGTLEDTVESDSV